MSRLTELISQIKSKDTQLGVDLEREFKALSSRREFGLNFERHRPEIVELPNRVVRKGDKVRILPKRGTKGSVDKQLWLIKNLKKSKTKQVAILESIGKEQTEKAERSVDDLIVIAEFQDYIYPGLVGTGKVERGDKKPYHTVINGENYHALKALTFTHKGKIDVIYIDPPYNTGAKDWKYNNDYVESDDLYRHSKWLAMMERRLQIAKELLNPSKSVLIITIDEKEYLRLGLLLEQTFSGGRFQMITTVINPRAGVSRPDEFTRVDEYVFVVQFGDSKVLEVPLSDDKIQERNKAPIWFSLMRTGSSSSRQDRPNLFYPIWITKDGTLHSVGDSVSIEFDRLQIRPPAEDILPIWPLRPNGTENRWQLGPESIRLAFSEGTARINNQGKRFTVNYLRKAEKRRIENGEIEVKGRDDNGALILAHREGSVRVTRPRTVWTSTAHDAGLYGSALLRALINERKFPFPKSLYAVEDTLRFFVQDNSDAIVLDFFSGSGTTAHAIMRLNRQDGGRRQSISITNNEVSPEEQRALRKKGVRPGDAEWEKLGICDYITKPRIKAVITGKTPDGCLIKGDYKFTDEFPMSDGFEENAEFFTLSYETPIAINYNLAFQHVAPLLWMRAGSKGKRIDTIPESGWEVVENYGVLVDLDKSSEFCKRIESNNHLKLVYIVTNDDRRFQSIAKRLPQHIEPVRLYESYLKNFQFTNDI